MRKIVIFDDSISNQRTSYVASFVDDYGDCLLHIEVVDDDVISLIGEAACVMVHDSLREKDRIKDELENVDVPRVCFSGSHPREGKWEKGKPNVVSEINKEEFYLNLKPFLENYKDTGEVDLRIIAFGGNYNVYLIKKWYMGTMIKLSNFPDEEVVVASLIDSDRESLQNFIENSNLDVNFDFVMNKISKGAYTVRELKEKLNSIINSIMRYGKNISSWV